MNKIAIFMSSLIFSTTSFGANLGSRIPANISELVIDCTSPKGFSGNSAVISGKMKLTPLPNGADKGVGKLKISLLNPLKAWSGEKNVNGTYDDLTSVGSEKYFHGGARIKNSEDIMDIYMNFTRPDLSFVEYSGETYKMSCKSH